MYQNFKKLNEKALPYVVSIQNGVDVDKNFANLSETFDPIVECVVKKIKHNGGVSVEDLKQEALIALWECSQNYCFGTPNQCSFYSYFYSSAMNALSNYVYSNQLPLTYNKHEKERNKPLREFEKRFYSENGCEPTIDDYIEAGFAEAIARRHCQYEVNLRNPGCCIDEQEDEISIEDIYEKIEEHEALYNAIAQLDDKHKQILQLLFFENMTQDDAADRLGVNRRTVIRRKSEALQQLKEILTDYE